MLDKGVINISENKTKWSYFPKLQTANEIKFYFDVRTQGHKEFFHYTSLKAINAILSSKTIRISSTNRFNDEKDRNQFGNIGEQKKYFSLCFTSGSNENLSLWYLYSGVDGKGGRIGLTYDKLVKLIAGGCFYLTEYDYEKNKSIGIKIPLVYGKNIEVTIRDVLYSKTDISGKCVDLKYNTMTNHGNVSTEEYEKYKAEFLGFNKTLIWYYEKESRMLIKLIGDLADMIDVDKDYAILWELTDKQISQIKIMFAPEIEDVSELGDYEHIKKFIFNSSRVRLSENAGDIHMNICAKCNYKEKFCSKCENIKQ